MLWTHRKSTEVEIGESSIDDFEPKQFCEDIRSGIKLPCSPNLYCCKKIVGGLLTGKTNTFNSVWIELARVQDYLSLEEYPWIPFSVTVTIWNKLEIPVLLVARFNTAAHANSREQNLLRIWRLDKVYIWRPLGKFREKSTQKPNSKILWAVLVQSHKKGFLKLTRRHSPRYYWSH